MNKKLICFGSGSYFKIMYYDFKGRDINFKVEAIIDNNPNKVGKSMRLMGDEIPILSLDMVTEKYQPSEICIMITTAFYGDVRKQLLENSYFDVVDITAYYEIKQKEVILEDELKCTLNKPEIPKIIHYCWFGGKPMPEHLQKMVDGWHEICPDYDFVCWNEKNYDVLKNTYTRTMYERKKWGYLSDYVRLDVVHRYGGIYLDIDVELLQSPKKLLYNKVFFGVEISGGINDGSGFGAVKGHPFIKKLMNVYENMDVNEPLNDTTNLGKEIEVFFKHGYKNNGCYQVLDDVAIYPYYVLTSMVRETGEIVRNKATVTIHHFEGSWG